MSGYISCEAAIKFINDCLLREEKLQSVEKATLLAVKDYLTSLPASDVRTVKRGEWTPVMEEVDDVGDQIQSSNEIYGLVYECSNCHHKMIGISNFCGECGADMRVTDNDVGSKEEET